MDTFLITLSFLPVCVIALLGSLKLFSRSASLCPLPEINLVGLKKGHYANLVVMWVSSLGN